MKGFSTYDQIQMIIIQASLSIFQNILIIIIALIVSIPFYFAWNLFAPIYLTQWLPIQFVHISYLGIVAFSLICTYLGDQISKLTPRLFSSN